MLSKSLCSLVLVAVLAAVSVPNSAISSVSVPDSDALAAVPVPDSVLVNTLVPDSDLAAVSEPNIALVNTSVPDSAIVNALVPDSDLAELDSALVNTSVPDSALVNISVPYSALVNTSLPESGLIDISAPDSAPTLAEQFASHQSAVRAHPCRAPQPRSLKTEDVMGPLLRTNQRAYPAWTVLHRCDRYSGCCAHYTRRQLCGVRSEETVSLLFHVRDAVVGGGEAREEMVRVQAQNHTTCECQDIED